MNILEFILDFAELFGEPIPDIQEVDEFRKIDSWDSLTGMAILNMIEEKYGVIIPVNDFIKLQTPREIFDYIQIQKA